MSKDSIVRSRKRIATSRRLLTRPFGGFALPRPETTDDQYIAALEASWASAQQSEIEREVRRTTQDLLLLRDLEPVPNA